MPESNAGDRALVEALGVPAYVTDGQGRVTQYNELAAALWGREPELGVDQWCGSWRIYNADGSPLALDECPMAIALREDRPVRGMEVIVERPDGTRRAIVPCPTPLHDEAGRLVGAVNVLLDVTERRGAEQAIRAYDEELRDLFNNALVGMHWIGADGTILKANEAELELLGFDNDEYIGHNISEFHIDQPELDEIMARLRRGETLRGVDARIRCRDGAIKDVLIDSNAFRWDGDELIQAQCSMRDVTAQRAAAETAFRLAAIVDSSDDAIVSKDLNGIVTSWNAAAERIFGYTAAEIVGQNVRRIIPAERLAEEDEVLRRVRLGERVDHFETVRRRKDGSEVEISLTVSPVRDASGRVIGASKVARSIGERKQTERALAQSEASLRDSEERFRFIAEHAPAMIWASGPDNDVVYLSQGYLDFVGGTLDEELGQGWAALVHPDDLPHRVEVAAAAVTRGEPFEVEYRLRRRDGEYRWLADHAAPIVQPDGTFDGYIGSLLDVTDRHEAEQRFRAAAALKDQFLGLVSHELRTPIAVILGNGLLLQTRSDRLEAANRQQALADIVAEAEKLEESIEHLLLLTRFDSSELELEPVSLSSLVDKCLQGFRRRHPRRQVYLEVEGDVPVALGQDTLLTLVIQNLLTNAEKYSPQEDPIELLVRVGASGRPELRVADRGIGLDDEAIAQIFTPFYRSPNARKRAGGLGLGLAVCQRVIEAHGGTISAVRRPGGGSEFFFSLQAEGGIG